MVILNILVTLLVGLGTGWFSALLGIGGGVIMIPLMVYLLKVPMNVAVGTSLAVIVPTALVGAWKHYQLGHLNIQLVLFLALGAVIGAYAGALTTTCLSGEVLRRIFGVLLLVTAVRMLI